MLGYFFRELRSNKMRKFKKGDRIETITNEIQISAFLNSGYEEVFEEVKPKTIKKEKKND